MNLKYLRDNAGLTQKEISEKINIDQSNYCKYELGKIKPSLEVLEKLANFYNVTIDFVLGRNHKDEFGYLSEDQINFVKTFLCLNQTNQMKTVIYAANLLAKQ